MIIDIDPIAFSLGPVSVPWYGIMVALAVITLVAWALYAAKKGARMTYDEVINGALVGIPSGVLGARLFHVLDYLDYFKDHPGEIFSNFGQGLAVYGAVLGAALGVWIYSLISKKSFGYIADMIAPGIILAQAIGRVGCTLNGCCYGVETDIFCAVTWAHGNQLVGPVHPTQIYEIIIDLIIFGSLLMLRKRFRPDGSLFLVYLTAYSAWRFGVDFIREGRELFLGLHEAQLIAIGVLIITVTLLITKTRWIKKGEEEIIDHNEEEA
ncbi:MAG: prolipoprotein diacylglyceryl transferase [Dehalococcoidales bacterium]|nr:prolipoprotein diacylglyceryl transferase [Dehalococcoidales bacterium]